MQPPFKRRDPGTASRKQATTPGRPTNSTWAFGRTVMHLTLNQADVGSTPTAPTKRCLCDAIGRHRLLKPSVLQVQFLPGVLAEMEQQRLGRFIPFTSVSTILTSATNAGVAQRQSNCLVNSRLQVQLLSPAPECECGAVASIPGFQPGDTSSSLVFRSNLESCECGVRANTGVCQSPDTSSTLVIRSHSPVTQR
jgi:hypothetical protein